MKYMKLLLVLVVSVIMITCSPSTKKEETKGWDVVIKGKVGFPQPGNLTLTEIRQDTLKPNEDTIHVKSNYTFEKKIHLTEPGYYRLSFYGRQFVNVILDTADIEVNADGNDANGFSEVKGSPDMDMIMEVQKYVQESQTTDEMKQLMAEFQEASLTKDEKKVEELKAKYQSINDKSYDKIAELIDKQPASLGLVNLLQNNSPLDKDKYASVYTKAAAKFTGRWATNFYGKGFVEFVNNIQRIAIGQPAPEISLANPDGKIITLSSFKGKFVLVDFWAKWCGPCRHENPNVVKAYNEFKAKNFDILGVSLDYTKEDWVKAIKEDGLVWNHVIDSDSKAAKDYNVKGIPFSLLIDPNGIIIAKNLRESSLQKKLAEVLNK